MNNQYFKCNLSILITMASWLQGKAHDVDQTKHIAQHVSTPIFLQWKFFINNIILYWVPSFMFVFSFKFSYS